MAPAESTTSPVVSLSVPTMSPAESTTVPVALVERAQDVAGGVDHHGAVDRLARRGSGRGGVRGVRGVPGVGRRGHHRLVAAVALRRCRTGSVGDRVGLVDRAVLDPGRDRVRIHGLGHRDPLVGQRLAGGPVARAGWRSPPHRSAPPRSRSARSPDRSAPPHRSRDRCPPRGPGSRRPPCPEAQSPPPRPAPRTSSVRNHRYSTGFPPWHPTGRAGPFRRSEAVRAVCRSRSRLTPEEPTRGNA